MAKPKMYTFADDSPVKGTSRKQRRNQRKSGNTIASGVPPDTGGDGGIGKKKSSGGLNASLGAKLERHFGNEAVRQHKQEKDAQSLTYSASSSVGGSHAGESTDSSFADIMKVLDVDDVNDSTEIAALMAAEGITDMSAQEYIQRAQARANMGKRSSGRSVRSGNASVACSLAYSEDGESTVADAMMHNRYGYGASVGGGGGGGASQTTWMMQSGQPSGERNGSGFGVMSNLNNSYDDLQSPTSIQDRTHKRESPKRLQKTPTRPSETPPRPTKAVEKEPPMTKSSRARAPTAESSGSNSSAVGTPPPRAPSERKSKRSVKKSSATEDEFDPLDCSTEAWYSQWWMCGFGDAIKDVMLGPVGQIKKSRRSHKAAEKAKMKRGEC